MLPYVLASALGGPLIDRVGARRFSIAADAASARGGPGRSPCCTSRRRAFGGVVVLVGRAGGLRGFGDTAKRASSHGWSPTSGWT